MANDPLHCSFGHLQEGRNFLCILSGAVGVLIIGAKPDLVAFVIRKIVGEGTLFGWASAITTADCTMIVVGSTTGSRHIVI